MPALSESKPQVSEIEKW